MKVTHVHMVNVPKKNGPDTFWEIREVRECKEAGPSLASPTKTVYLLNHNKEYWKVITKEEFEKLSQNELK